MQTVMAAVAARQTGRPVKLVVPRSSGFHGASFRPASRHHIRLGADKSGKMLAAIHEVDAQTSRRDLFPGEYAATSSRLYGYQSFRGLERLVHTDVQTPGYMRAPFEHPACFAMESCVDELAYELGQDPVALRLANDTTRDTATGRPFSSRHVGECLRRGAERFGWERRSMAPQSMHGDDGTQIGWGVATGTYPGIIVPAIARLKVTDDGRVVISVGGHEMGQGIRTALANAVARKLGVPPERVAAVVGDTRAVPQHLTAGSWGTASAIPTAIDAADAMLKALAELAHGNVAARAPAQILKAAGRPSLEVEAQRKAPGQPDAIFARLRSGLPSIGGPVYGDYVTFSYIAHFVEVRIEPNTRRIRVPRVVSVADCGRVVDGRKPGAWRRGLGNRRDDPRGERGRSAFWRFPQRRSRRICAAGECGYWLHRGGVHRQAGLHLQQRWRQRPRRGVHDGCCRRHCQCRLPRHRPAPPRPANPDRAPTIDMRAGHNPAGRSQVMTYIRNY